MLSVTATSLDRLDELMFALHDRYFDLDSMCLDREAGSLCIPFDGSMGETRGPFDHMLVIHGVIDVEYKDTERIGIYCFSRMKIDVHSWTIVLDADILRIDVHVRPDFKVTFET